MFSLPLSVVLSTETGSESPDRDLNEPYPQLRHKIKMAAIDFVQRAYGEVIVSL